MGQLNEGSLQDNEQEKIKIQDELDYRDNGNIAYGPTTKVQRPLQDIDFPLDKPVSNGMLISIADCRLAISPDGLTSIQSEEIKSIAKELLYYRKHHPLLRCLYCSDTTKDPMAICHECRVKIEEIRKSPGVYEAILHSVFWENQDFVGKEVYCVPNGVERNNIWDPRVRTGIVVADNLKGVCKVSFRIHTDSGGRKDLDRYTEETWQKTHLLVKLK